MKNLKMLLYEIKKVLYNKRRNRVKRLLKEWLKIFPGMSQAED